MPARKYKPSKSIGKKDNSPKARANEDKPRQPAESKPPRDSFPIVGIGASAGGVQALETFSPTCRRIAAWRLSSSSIWIPITRA